MRRVVMLVALCEVIVGLGYTYNQGSPASTYITTPVERGSITTQVKGERHGRAPSFPLRLARNCPGELARSS
jgi:hypothetical protein